MESVDDARVVQKPLSRVFRTKSEAASLGRGSDGARDRGRPREKLTLARRTA